MSSRDPLQSYLPGLGPRQPNKKAKSPKQAACEAEELIIGAVEIIDIMRPESRRTAPISIADIRRCGRQCLNLLREADLPPPPDLFDLIVEAVWFHEFAVDDDVRRLMLVLIETAPDKPSK